MGEAVLSVYTVRELQTLELPGAFLDQALWVFGDALGFSRTHSRVTSLAGTIRRHAGLGGFRAFGAFASAEPGDRLVGFSYGYTSQPGLWWREQIAGPMSPEKREYWLADAFELAELHVHPSAQAHKLGSRLHDSLLAGLPHTTALLSVMHRSERARRLYASRGWLPLVNDMRFATEPNTPFSVLGLRLPPHPT